MGKLDNREKRFVQEYLVDLDVERAAFASGYSKTTAKSKTYQWVSNGKVKFYVFDAIQKELKKRAQRCEISADRTLEEIAILGYSNIGDFVTWGPDGVTIKDASKLTEAQRACVAEVSEHRTKDGRTIKFKLHDKVKALDQLMKHLGGYAPVNALIDEKLLNLILGALPKEFAASVKAELQRLAAGKNP